MPSPRLTTLARWWTRKGAIRLEEDESWTEKEDLPFYQNDEEALKEEEYTHARLLFECVLASTWNAFCLGYLYTFPQLDPITGELLRPRMGFIYILLALVSIPLGLGMIAGAKALIGHGDEANCQREKKSMFGKFEVFLGFIPTVCCAGIWAIVAFVVREQTFWLKLDLAFTTLCTQALLIRGATGNLIDSQTDISMEKLDIHEFLRDTTLIHVYEDCGIPFSVERSAPLP